MPSFLSLQDFKKKIFFIVQYKFFSLFQTLNNWIMTIYLIFKVFKSHVRSDSDGNTILHLKQRVNHKLTKQSEL